MQTYRDAEGKLLFQSKPIQEWVLGRSFESICFALLDPQSSADQEASFHTQGVEHRAQLAYTLAQKRPLFAPVMATLQSLASSLTVYQHDWAYFNQLLLSFASFFQEEMHFYEQVEQQIFVAGARQRLSPPDLPFVSALMNLWAIQEPGPIWDLLRLYAKAHVEMPAAISGAIGYMSSRHDLGEWMMFTPWLENLAYNRLESAALKEIESKGCLMGFRKGDLCDPERYLLGKQIAEQLAKGSEVFYPLFQKLQSLEAVAQTYELSPRWEMYPVVALHALGLYPNWLAPWVVFCRLPQQIAQYRRYEQEVALFESTGENI